MKIDKNQLAKPFCLLLVTVIFSVLTAFVDRAAIGPEDTSVGFSSINGAVAGALGYNGFFDKVSDLVMVLSFLVVASFAFMGLLVLIKTKNIARVGKTILGLGVLYLVVAIIYVAFSKIADMDVVTQARSVRCVVIIAENGEALERSARNL